MPPKKKKSKSKSSKSKKVDIVVEEEKQEQVEQDEEADEEHGSSDDESDSGEKKKAPPALNASLSVPKLNISGSSPAGPSKSPRDISPELTANMMSPRAGTALLHVPPLDEVSSVKSFDVSDDDQMVAAISKHDSMPDQYLIAHGHRRDPEGAADSFATLSVVTCRGKQTPLAPSQLGPLLRQAFSLSALALVPKEPNAPSDAPSEYVAWAPSAASLIHFRLHGAGGPVSGLQIEELGKFPVPFPRYKPPPEIADDPEAVAAAKPRHRPLSFSLYREQNELFAVYHSPGGDIKRMDKGSDGSGYGDISAGLTPEMGVGLWIARVRLVRDPERNNRFRFDPSLVPSFGTVARTPGTVVSGCHAAGAPLPLLRLTLDKGVVFTGEGKVVARLDGAGHLRCVHGSPKGVDVFSNGENGAASWHRLTPSGESTALSKCQTMPIKIGRGCVAAIAPITGKIKAGSAPRERLVSPRGKSNRQAGTIRKAGD